MWRIALQTLRARGGSLAGAFAAVLLAVTFAHASGLLMAGALEAPGGGRYSAADAVVRADPAVPLQTGEDAESVDVVPAPRLAAGRAAEVAAVPGVRRAVADVAFPIGLWRGAGERVSTHDVFGHGWSGAALTPYGLVAGHAPSSPHEVVADARLGLRVGHRLRLTAPGGERRVRVAGVASAAATRDGGQRAVFFADGAARELAATGGSAAAIGVFADRGVSSSHLQARLRRELGSGFDVVDRRNAATADPGDPRALSRASLVAIFGTMGGIAGFIALFVISGTFSLAMAQRRREIAVLRALGATPRQVRRLIAGEAFIVALVAGGIGVALGGPLASALAAALQEHGIAPDGFAPGSALVPAVAALALGFGVSRVAVTAAGRRAGRTRAAEALRDAAVEHARPGLGSIVCGVLALAGGAAMAIVFKGEFGGALSVLTGVALAIGTCVLGRWLLGVPAALAGLPMRFFGGPGLLAQAGLRAHRWRTAALATPVVLVAMLAGTQAIVQSSMQDHVRDVGAQRVIAGHAVVGRHGAPLTAGTAHALAVLPGVHATTATVATEVYGLDRGLGENSPWPAAGLDRGDARRTLDLHVVAGSLDDVGGDRVAVSRVVAAAGGLHVGDALETEFADRARRTLRVAAIYGRSAGWADVVLDGAVARRHSAVGAGATVFVAGGAAAGRSLARYAAEHPGVQTLGRGAYLDTLDAVGSDGAWGVWLIIVLSAGFALLAMVNTAAMATGERAHELATLRLLGATSAQAVRAIVLELLPVVAVAVVAGGVITAVAVAGSAQGLTGAPIHVPAVLAGGLLAGALVLGLAAAAVATRLVLRTSAAGAMRARD